MLETSDVPISFSLPQMKMLDTTFELDPKRDKITFAAFGLYCSPAGYPTMGYSGLDLQLLRTSQNRVSDLLCRRKMQLLLSRNEIQHILLTQENWTKIKMINIVFVQAVLPFLKDEDEDDLAVAIPKMSTEHCRAMTIIFILLPVVLSLHA